MISVLPPCRPKLQDPNTGVAMFESAYIVDYLAKTYGMPTSSL